MSRLKYPVPHMTPVARLAEVAEEGSEYRPWYVYAGDQIAKVAPILGTDPGRLADMLALFSPRVSVSRSATWAVTYIQTGRFMADCTRGHKAAVEHYLLTGEIRGPKTGPFAKALRGDPNAIVLDTWMGVAMMPDTNPGRFEVRAVWDKAANRLREVAAYLGWPVAETQAAIWGGTYLRSHINGRVPALDLVGLVANR